LPQALRAWRMRHELQKSGYDTVATETGVEYAALYIGLVVLLLLMSYQMHEQRADVG
jgi:hypothetical protein